MKRILQAVVIFGTLAVFLGLVNRNIFSMERQIAEGQSLYLRLAPVDPRSLIQGDYMQLDYEIARDAARFTASYTRGKLVVSIDEQQVAHFERLYTEGEPLADDERLFNYRMIDEQVFIGVRSFFFQEGLADAYAEAQYADVRLTGEGGVLLIDLVGENFEKLISE